MTQLISITGLSQSTAQAQTLSVGRGFRVPGGSTPASFTTAGPANSNLTYTAKAVGAAGNAVTVAYVVAGASTPLTVGVVANAITVNVATSAGSAATSTGAQVRAAVIASGPASALVNVANAPGNNGTGVVAAFGATNLTGGVNAGTAEVQVQPGKLTTVDIDRDDVRKRLSRNFDRWIVSPNGSLQFTVRSLLTPSSTDVGQSAVARGFRLPGQGLSFQGTDTSQNLSTAAAIDVDLTNPNVRRALRSHIGRWCEANSTNTLVTIRGLRTSNAAAGGGLSSRGFRINKYGQSGGGAGQSTVATVTPTANVQVDLADHNVRRALRRNVGRWVVVSSP